MTTYNPNDFSPMSGKEINSLGNVVTPADGINTDGSQNVVISNNVVVFNEATSMVTVQPGQTIVIPCNTANTKTIMCYTWVGATHNYKVNYQPYQSNKTNSIPIGADTLIAAASQGNMKSSIVNTYTPYGQLTYTNNDTVAASVALLVYGGK